MLPVAEPRLGAIRTALQYTAVGKFVRALSVVYWSQSIQKVADEADGSDGRN